MRRWTWMTLALVLAGCGSEVVVQSSPGPDDPPPVADPPEDPPPNDPPEDPPDDPPEDPPEPPEACEMAVTVESVGGSIACGYGGISNFSPGTLFAIEPVPEQSGLRFVMQGCPDGADCTCEVTVSCVGEDIAAVFADAPPIGVQAWIQPTELIVGQPGPWECIDCSYGPAFFHASAQLDTTNTGGTLTVEPGAVTATQTIDGATFATHELDATAYVIGGLAPVQMEIGSATADEGKEVALAMDDDLIALSLRNLDSTWCIEGCDPSDPEVGQRAWVVYGPAYWLWP